MRNIESPCSSDCGNGKRLAGEHDESHAGFFVPYGGFLSHGGSPSSHPFEIGIFHCKPSSCWGTPIYGNLHIHVGNSARWSIWSGGIPSSSSRWHKRLQPSRDQSYVEAGKDLEGWENDVESPRLGGSWNRGTSKSSILMLVGGLEHFYFFHLLGIMIPSD
jgi:hypothetical protein